MTADPFDSRAARAEEAIDNRVAAFEAARDDWETTDGPWNVAPGYETGPS